MNDRQSASMPNKKRKKMDSGRSPVNGAEFRLPQGSRNRNPLPAERPSTATADNAQQASELRKEVAELQHQLQLRTRLLGKEREEFQNNLRKIYQGFYVVICKERQERDTTNWTRKIAGLEVTIEDMTKEMQGLKIELATQREQIRVAQENAFKRLEEAQWTPLEDSDVRAQLKGLESAIRVWARDYSNRNLFTEQLSSVVLETLGAELQGQLHGGRQMIDTVRAMSKSADKIPFILTQSILSVYVFRYLVADPFHFVQEMGLNGEWTGTLGVELNGLYGELQNVDRPHAHWWRCQTLRLLDGLEAKNHAESNISAMRKWTCEHIAQILLNTLTSSTCGSLPMDEAARRHDKLVSLLMTASALSTRLWTQRTDVRCTFFHNKEQFYVKSPDMLAHRLHKLNVGDTRLDCHDLLLTVQPAITAHGNSDGDNYHEEKVWLKGIVFIEE
ncbi:uncharacterized protein GIQ15_05785 [Arthroderma uncinatum]|uniref:uncharacterized protein n=1 Tax=Arthroderma uncinatum TaxID=74035 RepID=UPI00144A6FC3|nr:uncharacterized protein GIQ15_05785 [Arthroderma uncinatum]KAF3480438.1 hypothetical protein GIQ15_05785 [Arthroderma uncinatum]